MTKEFSLHSVATMLVLTFMVFLSGCFTLSDKPAVKVDPDPVVTTKAEPAKVAAEPRLPAPGTGLYGKPGFITFLEDGRLWILKPGEKKSDKHITLVGAGPGGMTVKAAEKDTALSYLYHKPGFDVEVVDGRLWVLRPGQEKSEKHITLVGAGPRRMTMKALDRDTALHYIASKPGFNVEVENGRLWVLRPGQEKSEKHITLVGAGPRNTTVKALDKNTAIHYLAAQPGFEVEIDEDGRIWVFRNGGSKVKSDKHITRVGAGPMKKTVKALDRQTLDAYLATQK
jgi:hypothetical protein